MVTIICNVYEKNRLLKVLEKAKEDSTRRLEDMMMSITECVSMIFEEAEPEEKEIIRKHIRKMSEL